MTRTVRDFSTVGPCINIGEIERETPQSYFIRDRFNGGKIARVAKHKSGRHVEACPSCRDHTHSQYPNGYEN